MQNSLKKRNNKTDRQICRKQLQRDSPEKLNIENNCDQIL